MSQDEQIKSLKDILKDAGLSANPSKSEIKEFQTKRQEEIDAEGIDSRNIIHSRTRQVLLMDLSILLYSKNLYKFFLTSIITVID